MRSFTKRILSVFLGVILLSTVLAAPVQQSKKADTKKGNAAKEEQKKKSSDSAAEAELEKLAGSSSSGAKSKKESEKKLDKSVPAEPEAPLFIRKALEAATAQEEPAEPENEAVDSDEKLQQILAEIQNTFDISPRTVAKYLLAGGDFTGLNDALNDLVRAGVFTPEDVARFKQEVSWHYENLLMSQGPQLPLYSQDDEISPFNGYPVEEDDESYGEELMEPRSDEEEYNNALARLQLGNYLDKKASIDGLLSDMLADYFTKYGADESYENLTPEQEGYYENSPEYGDVLPLGDESDSYSQAELPEQYAETPEEQLLAEAERQNQPEKKDVKAETPSAEYSEPAKKSPIEEKKSASSGTEGKKEKKSDKTKEADKKKKAAA